MAGNQLTWLQILGYGTGHVFNDICASMWFTYLLLFFQEVDQKYFLVLEEIHLCFLIEREEQIMAT